MTRLRNPVELGHTILGPIFSEWALRLWLFAESQPPGARLLFCARGGLRLRRLYESFLLKIGREPDTPTDDLMVSRLVAARSALLARSPAALDEIGREFKGAPMGAIVEALVQSRVPLSSVWNEPFERDQFARLLWASDEGQSICVAMASQADLFRAHLDEKAKGERVILCDTGLYGSTMRLLQAAYPERDLSCVMLARSNYKGFETEHFSKTIGLCVEVDAYSVLELRSSLLRFWHLVEHVFEPDLESVRVFTPDEYGCPRANLERPGWRSAIEPRADEMFAGVLDYVRGLDGTAFATRIYDDSSAAWPEFKRLVTRPRHDEVSLLAVGERSRDFGRSEKVKALAEAEPLSFGRLQASLWREGAVASSYPALRALLLTGIEIAHGARNLRRAIGATARLRPLNTVGGLRP